MTTNTILKIVMLCVVCAATMMSGCLEVDDPVNANTKVETVKDVYGGDTSTSTSTPAPTPNIPIPVPTITPGSGLVKFGTFGTYKNPTPLDLMLISRTGALCICITNINRGEPINNMVQYENMFNDAPKSGNEYMLVGIVVVYIKKNHLDADEKFLLSSNDFDAYANGVECDSPYLVLPDEFDTSTSTYMMPDSASSVWMIYEVPKDARVTIAYDRIFVDDVYYFDAGTENFDYGDKS